jgi:hypothetical protein
MKHIFALLLFVTFSAHASTQSNNAADLDVSGTWWVYPANSTDSPEIVAGIVKLTQSGNYIEGIYALKSDENASTKCSMGPYTVKGSVEGNTIYMTASSDVSTLTGQVSGNVEKLDGQGTEVFTAPGCTGSNTSNFVMMKMPE